MSSNWWNANNLEITLPSSSSSSSSEEEERRAQRRRANQEIDNMIEAAAHIHQCNLLSAAASPPARRRSRADRDRESGHLRLYNDYFSERPVYGGNFFRRRFRMQKHVFERIMNTVVANDQWFQQRRDATGRLGLSPLQKCVAAIRQLAYGYAADACDEYIRIGETTARLALEKFTQGVINQFGYEYLRRPNEADLNRLLQIGEERGFPGMIGSIDCMHWEWKNCPTAWKGQYQGRAGVATLVLEAVASQDLWIWHSFFRMPGSCNDINVLHRSPVFDDVLEGRAPPVQFVVNGHEYNMGYYLTDGIYPKWSTFVKSITSPQTRKHRLFAERQEAARKDVERAFGVLQARFAIVRKPSLAWDVNILHNIMLSCIIMHNMIVEDERHTYENYTDTSEFDAYRPPRSEEDDGDFQYSTDRIVDMNIYLQHKATIENQQTHLSLKNNLVEHMWNKFGDNSN